MTTSPPAASRADISFSRTGARISCRARPPRRQLVSFAHAIIAIFRFRADAIHDFVTPRLFISFAGLRLAGDGRFLADALAASFKRCRKPMPGARVMPPPSLHFVASSARRPAATLPLATLSDGQRLRGRDMPTPPRDISFRPFHFDAGARRFQAARQLSQSAMTARFLSAKNTSPPPPMPARPRRRHLFLSSP